MIPVVFQSGITIDSEKAFRVVLSCDQPGEVVIKLQALFIDHTVKQAVDNADLYDDVRIQVNDTSSWLFRST